MRKILLIYTAVWLLCIQQVCAAPAIAEFDSTTNVAAADTAINFDPNSTGDRYKRVTIKTSPTAPIVYINFKNGTATTANFAIDPGSAYTIPPSTQQPDGLPGIHYYAAAATGTISVVCFP